MVSFKAKGMLEYPNNDKECLGILKEIVYKSNGLRDLEMFYYPEHRKIKQTLINFGNKFCSDEGRSKFKIDVEKWPEINRGWAADFLANIVNSLVYNKDIVKLIIDLEKIEFIIKEWYKSEHNPVNIRNEIKKYKGYYESNVDDLYFLIDKDYIECIFAFDGKSEIENKIKSRVNLNKIAEDNKKQIEEYWQVDSPRLRVSEELVLCLRSFWLNEKDLNIIQGKITMSWHELKDLCERIPRDIKWLEFVMGVE